MGPSLLGQLLLNGFLATTEHSFVGKLVAYTLSLMRERLTRVWDPLVQFRLDGYNILLPLSHSLPKIRKRFPDYSANLGRIAAAIAAKDPYARAIDIGANVGDSVAIIRAKCSMPILCIEADAKFLTIFEKNMPLLGRDIYLFAGFVAMDTGPIVGEAIETSGTARLVPAAGDTRVNAESLEDILKRFPEFQRPRLLKSDTDGFDLPILHGALDFLQEVKPVLFFEYDPFYLSSHGHEGLQTLRELLRIGYSKVLVYDNFGDFLLATNLESKVLEDLHAYFSGRGAQRYMDLCLFSDDDVALFEALHSAERTYFATRRPT
jgi:FkbM family methyltransferase